MDDMLTDPILDNSNKQSSFNSLSQNTLMDIKVEGKDNFDIKNSLPSTPLNHDLGTPSSLNANKTINSIHNSPDPMSVSPINNIMSPQNILSNNNISNDLMKTVTNTVSSPLVNVQSQNSISSLSNDLINNNNASSITIDNNNNNKNDTSLNGIKDNNKNSLSSEKNNDNLNSNNVNNNVNHNENDNNNNMMMMKSNNNNNNINVSTPLTNDNSIDDDNLTIPHEWELKNSNQEYLDSLVEKYHTGKWSYEPKLKSYLISFKKKKLSKKDLYRFVMSKRIKYMEDIVIEDQSKKNLNKEIKRESDDQEEDDQENPNKKIKIEDDVEDENENKENKNINVNCESSNSVDNKVFIDYGSAWRMLNVYEYNPINDIIEKSLTGIPYQSNFIYNAITHIKEETQNNIQRIKSENVENKNVLDKIAQKIFIEQYTGSLSSWNKSLENSLSAIILSKENQLYDEHIIPSLASKALNQLQIIFEDLFGSDIDQKFSMKSIYIEGPLTIKQLYGK